MNIWQQVEGQQFLARTEATTWRVVEDQSKSTTRKFVDTHQEHEVLEALLEESKPELKQYSDEGDISELHYLLSTPFRYPPLHCGSRFGTRHERNLFYASAEFNTSLCEKAFHTLRFLKASEGHLGGKTIQHTGFEVNMHTEKFIDLCAPPFNQFETLISSKIHYEHAQRLGSSMRVGKVEAFKFRSARCLNNGVNYAAFSPKVFPKKKPNTIRTIQAYATKEIVEFSYKVNLLQQVNCAFPLESFILEGEFPIPIGA